MKYASILIGRIKCTSTRSCVQLIESIRGHATCILDVVERKVSALLNPNRIKFLKNEDNDDDDTKKEKDRERSGILAMQNKIVIKFFGRETSYLYCP